MGIVCEVLGPGVTSREALGGNLLTIHTYVIEWDGRDESSSDQWRGEQPPAVGEVITTMAGNRFRVLEVELPDERGFGKISGERILPG
jgi:hypothetical protein